MDYNQWKDACAEWMNRGIDGVRGGPDSYLESVLKEYGREDELYNHDFTERYKAELRADLVLGVKSITCHDALLAIVNHVDEIPWKAGQSINLRCDGKLLEDAREALGLIKKA